MRVKCIEAGGICPRGKPCQEVCRPPAGQPAVGDTESKAMGTGARFNNSKPPMETIPVWIISNIAKQVAENRGESFQSAHVALQFLGSWQQGCKGSPFLYDAMAALGNGALEEAAQVFKAVTERPVKPYPLWNWMKGMPWSVPTACAVRHLIAILRGEENDPETGLPHRGHVMCNLIMLAQYESTWREGDDRPLQYLKPRPTVAEMVVAMGSAKCVEGQFGMLTVGNPKHAVDCAVLVDSDNECTCGAIPKSFWGPETCAKNDHVGGPYQAFDFGKSR